MRDIKRKAITGLFWKLMERFFAQGLTLVVSIIIARILSPADYSVVGIVTIFFNFANLFITSGLNTALIQKKDSDSLDYSTVLFTSFFSSVIVYGILYFSAPVIADIYHQDLLIKMIRTMGFTLPFLAVKAVWCSYISSNLLFRKFFVATLGGTIVSGALGIYLALEGFGAWALIVQQMTNTCIDTIVLVACTRVHLKARFSMKRLRSLYRYSWKIFASSLIGAVYSESSPLVIGVKFSAMDLSYYTKGKSFPSMLSTTATSTVSAVLFPVFAKYQDDKEKILYYTRLFIRLSSFVCFPVMLGFFSVSDIFIRVVLTEKWLPAVYYIKVFCICNMFDVIAIGNCETIKAIGRSDIYLIIEIIKKTGYFITLLFFINLSTSGHTLVLAYVVCAGIQIVVNSIPNIRLIGYRLKMQLQDLLPNLAISVSMCVASLMMGLALPKSVLALVLQIVTGIAVFTALCLITKNPSFQYLLNMGLGLLNGGIKNEQSGIQN